MDLYSFNINSASELRLRRHIREVLLPYVRTHLTLDHVAFTEKVVEELLLQTLEYVPLADATSFFLPTEPFEVLTRSLHSLDLIPPEERWATPSETARHLRTFFPPPPPLQDLPTERCWLEDDHYMKLSLMCRPISSPVLSERARRETPKLGGTRSRTSIPHTKFALTAFLDLQPLSLHGMEDLFTPSVDDVLDLRFKLDPATSARVRPFLQSVSVPPIKKGPVDCFRDMPNVSELMNYDSPPRQVPSLDSPPLFSRVAQRRVTRGSTRSDPKGGVGNPVHVSHLASMLQAVSPELIDGEDSDINGHHMEVVNGWTTVTFSSPPPPSLHSSDGGKVNELWNVSPAGTPATSLMAAKMDEVEIPRIRKFGHKNTMVDESTNDNGAVALLTGADSPGFFITSFISAPIPMRQTQKPITPQPEGIKFGMQSPRPFSPGQSTSNSLLGQPPSTAEKLANEGTSTNSPTCVIDIEEQRFDDAVASVYISTSQDPFSYILEEKLDDKNIILMDVPNLPPPTAHRRDPTLFLEGMQSLVAPKRELALHDTLNHCTSVVGPTAFLRQVKGIKLLALDLSWRPFNFGKTIPTDEEVAGVASPIQPGDEGSGYYDKYGETASFLHELDTPPISAEDAQPALIPKFPRGCEKYGTSPTPKRAEELGHVEYLLTQQERMRASGVKFTLEAEVGVQGSMDTEQGTAGTSDDGGGGDIPAPHRNLCQSQEHPGSRDTSDLMEYRSRNPTNRCYSFDDSGVDMTDNNLDQFSTSEFGIPHLLLTPLQDDLLQDMETPSANKNVDNQSENKENTHHGVIDDCYAAEYQSDLSDTQYDWNGYFQVPESDIFEPLSFPSQSQLLGPSDDVTKMQDVPPLTPGVRSGKYPEHPTNECEQTESRVTKRRRLDDLVLASFGDLFSTFIGLRNQSMSNRVLVHSETRNDTPTPHQTLEVPEQILPRATPDDVFNQHTVRLPEPWIPAAVVHRYLASMTLIQKRALVRQLQGHHCRVDLVERYDLGGADIIIDPDSSVLFIPLLALPAHLESTVERICCESWRYLNLLVVFEAFPSAQSYKVNHSRDDRATLYAYTPPVCNAIKKLRRNLGIADGCGTMDSRCTVTWAFANDIEEAAKFVRCFGDEICAISKERGRGILWDEREWLEEEEREGESDLAKVHGMNAFSAFVMLFDRTLEAILDLSPEARLAGFGQLLGEERIAVLNAVIESRLQQIAPDIADSVVETLTLDADVVNGG